MIRRAPRSLSAITAMLTILAASLAPASAAPVKPAPPCTAPTLPEPVATRFTRLGGVERFGCPVDTNGPVYLFRDGRIEAIPQYGSSATYAAIVDRDRIVHLYLSDTDGSNDFDVWLVRLSFDGSLVNQVKYSPGDGDVGGTYAANVLVHPGNRHGTFDIAMEGCFKALFGQNSCMGWSGADFVMDL